ILCTYDTPHFSTTFERHPSPFYSAKGLLVLLVKNWKKYFSFEVQILDDKTVRQWIKFPTIQKENKVDHFRCILALNLGDGWSHKTVNLKCFTADCLILACRFHQIHDKLPAEFKLPLPVQRANEIK
uniref:CFA20 domain-containing protein n=1 Tax=Oryzias latipes TaxID=8090 RepID=A0A3B3HN24_ORYLA